MNILCEIINDHEVKIVCSIIFRENHVIPSFMEKILGQIVNKIFIRLKQFIEKQFIEK